MQVGATSEGATEQNGNLSTREPQSSMESSPSSLSELFKASRSRTPASAVVAIRPGREKASLPDPTATVNQSLVS